MTMNCVPITKALLRLTYHVRWFSLTSTPRLVVPVRISPSRGKLPFQGEASEPALWNGCCSDAGQNTM